MPLLSLLIAVVAAVVVAVAAVGGAGFWLVKSGRLGTGGPAKVEAATRPEPKFKLIPLDPLLVNLADPDGHSYLRVAMTLKVEDMPPAKGEKPKEEAPAKGKPVNEFEPVERDAALSVIGRSTSAELLAAGGKESLKKQLAAALAQQAPEAHVADVLFTEFLVQR